MERLTLNDLDSVCYDSWELCGLDHVCQRDCKDCHIPKMIIKLAKLEDLEEQRRLIKLPCKVDEYVYKIITQHSNYDDTPYKIVSTVCFRLDMIYEIGKTVFLTREEAELKLKEIQNEPM